MRILKYDVNYGRRKLLENMAYGLGGGVFMPLEKLFASEANDQSLVYPEEMYSIEAQTKGKISPGDRISAENVEHVKHLIDESIYEQVTGPEKRTFLIKAPETDPRKLYNQAYYERTVEQARNGIQGVFGDDGNVYHPSGGNWTGGNPFINPKTGPEVWCNLALSWGGYDQNCYIVHTDEIDQNGRNDYTYWFQWAELQMSARHDGKIFRDRADEVRRQTVYFAHSPDVRGTTFMSVWYYDQTRIPELYGYLPEFRRVRQFPAEQRFEPLIPGAQWFLSDPWGVSDPWLTWGEHKIVDRKPMLGTWGGNFELFDDGWRPPEHPTNPKYWDIPFEMAPDVIVTEGKPTGFPRSPVGFKRIYVDARNSRGHSSIRYDRQNEIWSNFEMSYGLFKDDNRDYKRPDGNTAWSWQSVFVYDHQRRRCTRTYHRKEAPGLRSRFDTDPDWLYETYGTQAAIQRLGRA